MDRFCIFVDASYLIMGAGGVCFGESERRRLVVNYESVCNALRDLGRERTGVEHLRTYWYDAAPDRLPTDEHRRVASLEGVKLRLGRLTPAGQKGVDSLIVHDLIALSYRRAMANALLVAGDEDLLEGVKEAQDYGVKVTLLGMEAANSYVSNELRCEADDVRILDERFLRNHIGLRRLTLAEPAAPEPETTEEPMNLREIGRRFGVRWLSEITEEAAEAVCRVYPFIPAEIDRALLDQTRKIAEYLSDQQRKELREGFWEVVTPLRHHPAIPTPQRDGS